MEHLLEQRDYHLDDELKVSHFSWPSASSLVPAINFLPHFLFLPVFLQILLCESTAQDIQRTTWNLPAAPTLSWSPSYQTLLKGEEIELKCSPPGGQKGEHYFFYRNSEKGEETRYQEQIGNTLLIQAKRMAPKAKFACSYTVKNREGRRSRSRKSNRAEFTIIDPPPAPSLSADPSEPLYLVGENISLRCSIPDNTVQSWRPYLFSQIRKNENETSIKDLDWHEDNSLVLTATREDSGLHKCRYREWKYGRTISSDWSHPVSIVVRDPLLPPVLKLHPPSGSLQEGKVLQIQCLPNEGNNTKRFHFSWKGVEMASSNEGLRRSSRDPGLLTLNTSAAFLYAKGNGSLGLACRSEENINGRWIMSPWSQIVNITVLAAPSAPSVGYAALALLVLLLGAPLVFCCSRKKNGCQRRSEPKEKKEEVQLNDLGSEDLDGEDLQNSEFTCAFVKTSSTVIPFEPRTKNHLRTQEVDQVIYNNVRVQATSRTAH
ncbi:uncharacterized protein LOC120305659 isoform X2 [Crotalus tigris]|uniref:uncharacterized protein LOC120305659 isoform X2 n=1 Tax=Crotalus tigris TaxID=88082 RepID=UPI00192F8358|nr:uncharacterized protein LOC120305659 isoform X2 [Crotalus tigris]